MTARRRCQGAVALWYLSYQILQAAVVTQDTLLTNYHYRTCQTEGSRLQYGRWPRSQDSRRVRSSFLSSPFSPACVPYSHLFPSLCSFLSSSLLPCLAPTNCHHYPMPHMCRVSYIQLLITTPDHLVMVNAVTNLISPLHYIVPTSTPIPFLIAVRQLSIRIYTNHLIADPTSPKASASSYR